MKLNYRTESADCGIANQPWLYSVYTAKSISKMISQQTNYIDTLIIDGSGGANMVVPLDGIRAIHNAFRKDMATLDIAAKTAAQGSGVLDAVEKRYVFLNEILVWHATGEEKSVFPAVEKVAPLVPEPYERDHRGLDSLFDLLDKAVNKGDLLECTRTTRAFDFHLNIHLNKEEAHLYRIFNERIPMPEQASIMGEMAQQVPQDRFPDVVTWLFPLLGPNDRENMVRIWQQSLPNPVFTNIVKLVQATIGNDWAELTRRIPELK